jgi:hypothetical protein
MLADHRQAVAAPEDLDCELVFDLREIAVEFAAEIDEETVVGKLQESLLDVLGEGRVERADTQ